MFFAIGPSALLHWIPWYLAALPAATGLATWLGRFLMQLDGDQQPGTATLIRIPRRESGIGQSGGSSGSALRSVYLLVNVPTIGTAAQEGVQVARRMVTSRAIPK